MDENGIITGRIPSSGSGIHKTYEESVIRYNCIEKLMAYNNQYFVDEEGHLSWADYADDYEDMIKNPKYTKVDILSAECTPENNFIVEFIDSKVLRHHLVAEAVERRSKANTSEKENTNALPSFGAGIHKTYPESTFLLLGEVEFSELCRLSYIGIYFSKKLGKVVFPKINDIYDSTGYSYIENRRVYMSEINEHLNDYIELSILNVVPNGNKYIVEVINKDILESYLVGNEFKLKL